MADDGTIILGVKIEAKDLDAQVSELSRTLTTGLDGALGAAAGVITKTVAGAAAVVGAAAAAAFGTVTKMGFQFNMEVEQYKASLETLLGSAEKANKLLGQLREFADATPFELSHLAHASQLLLAFGEDVNQLMPDLRMLGDISMGSVDAFNGLALAFGQIQAAGKLTKQDLNQLISRGFNPLQEISKKTGESLGSLLDRVSDGEISFEMVAEAMRGATEEGGRFFDSVNKQSMTASGQFATLMDNLKSRAGEIAKPFNDAVSKEILPALNSILEGLDTSKIVKMTQGAADEISAAFKRVAREIETSLKTGDFSNVVSAAGDIIADIITKAVKAAPDMLAAGIKLLKAFASGITESMPAITEAGKQLAATFADAFLGPGAYDAVLTFMNVVVEKLTTAASIVEPILSALFNVMKGLFLWIIGNERLVRAALAGIAAGFASLAAVTAFTSVTSAISAMVQAITAAHKAVNLVTIAQHAWNVAVTANPLGVIAAAAGVLTGAVVLLWGALDNGADSTKRFRERNEELAKSIELGAEAAKKLTGEYEKSKSDAENAAAANSRLTDGVYKLSKTAGGAEGDMARLNEEVSRLNTIMPEINLEVADDGTLNRTREYVKAMAGAADAAAMLSLAEDRRRNLELERPEKEKELAEALRQRADIEREIADTELRMSEALDKDWSGMGTSAAEVYETLQTRLVILNNELDASDTNVKDAQAAFSEFASEIERAAADSGDFANRFAEADAALAGFGDKFADAYGEISGFAAKITDAESKAAQARQAITDMETERLELMEKGYEEYAGITTNALEDVPKRLDTTMRKMTAQLQKNTEEFSKWSVSLAEIAKLGGEALGGELDAGFLEYLKNLGIEGRGIVEEAIESIKNGGSEKFLTMQDAWKNSNKAVTEAIRREYDDPDFTMSVLSELDKISEEIKRNDSIIKAAEKTIGETKNAALAYIKTVNFESLGINMTDGIRWGIALGRDGVLSEVKALMDGAFAAGQKAADSHSPSKRAAAELGKPFAQGVAVGIKEGAQAAADAARVTVETALGASSEALKAGIADYEKQLKDLDAAIAESKRAEDATARSKALKDEKAEEERSRLRQKWAREDLQADLKARKEADDEKLKLIEAAVKKEKETYEKAVKDIGDRYSAAVKQHENEILFLGNEDDIMGQVDVYRRMLTETEATIAEYRAAGLSGNSDEILALEKQWLQYSEDITKIYENQKKEQLKVIKDFAYDEKTVAVSYAEDASDVKIKLFGEEYIARVRLIDEELAAFLEANNVEVAAIIDKIALTDKAAAKRIAELRERKDALLEESKAEKAQQDAAAQAKRLAAYDKSIADAQKSKAMAEDYEAYQKAAEAEKKAEADKLAYIGEMDYKAREAERQAEIKELEKREKAEIQSAKNSIKEQTKLAQESQKTAQEDVVNLFEIKPVDVTAELETQKTSEAQYETYYAKLESMRDKYYKNTAEERKISDAKELAAVETQNIGVISVMEGFFGKWKVAGETFMDMLLSGIESRYGMLDGAVREIAELLASVGLMDTPDGIPAYGAGGVVTSPRLAVVGDTPEAIIPLDRLSEIFMGAVSVGFPLLPASAVANTSKNVSLTQNVTIVSPERTPAQNARAVRSVMKEFGERYE